MKLRYFIIYIFFIAACSTPEPVPNYDHYVSHQSVKKVGKDAISILLSSFGGSQLTSDVLYNVNIYTFEYKTQLEGENIIASGVVAIPETNEPLGMVSVQHGTIVAQGDAPSSDIFNSLSFTEFYTWIASTGTMVVIPDYIGFGSSAEYLHPYYIEQPTADAIIDMLLAVEEFAEINSIEFNEDIFLMGYSQGGYATLAAHKALEEGLAFENSWNLLGSAPGAGGYSIPYILDDLFTRETYDQPFYLGFIAESYLQYSNTGLEITDIFQTPYASKIAGLLDGTKDGAAINAELTNDLSALVNQDFLLNYDTDIKYSQFLQAIENNSPINWTPEKPVHLYHGTEDITVPYSSSTYLYDLWSGEGVSENVLSFTPIEGGTHSSAATTYFIEALEFYLTLR